jgi:hypothetical protein
MQAQHLTSIGLNLMTYKKSFEYDSIRESSVDLGSLAYVAIFNYKFYWWQVMFFNKTS